MHSYESTVITEDLRHTNLDQLIKNGLNYTHNDTLIRSIIHPHLTHNFPSFLVDPWFTSIEHITDYLPFTDSNTEIMNQSYTNDQSNTNHSLNLLRRGPVIGYNRTVSICRQSTTTTTNGGGGEENEGIMMGRWITLPSYTYDISSTWLYVTDKIRIPVSDVWNWLRDDINKEYCWSVRQYPPVAYLSTTSSSSSSNNNNTSTTPIFQDQLATIIQNIAKEQNLPGDQSFRIHLSDRDLTVISFLPSSSISQSSHNSPLTSSSCTPGTVRLQFTEWSFPSTDFELIARLALVNDTWLEKGKEYAHSLGVPSALDPPPSSIVRLFSSIVPIDLTYREWTRDQIYTKQLHNDTRMYYQDIITFGREFTQNKRIEIDEDYLQTLLYGESYFPTGLFSLPIHWATRSKWYPPVIPSLESIFTPLSPPSDELVWTLIHWHPSWLVHEYERIQAKDPLRSPPLSSYVIAKRQFPPQDFFGIYFGEGKGIAVFIFFCISVVILFSIGMYAVEKVGTTGYSTK